MVRIMLALGRAIVVVSGWLGLFVVPNAANAQICSPFTDVPAGNSFCSDIQWMFNTGLTTGCGTSLFCPTGVMPRQQMAAFLRRMADKVAFKRDGNAFGATAVLGTTDNQALEVRVGNARAMRYEPNVVSPNVIGGSPANGVTPGVRGGTIAGGGLPAGDSDPVFGGEGPNRVTDAYGTVGGGYDNVAGDSAGTTVDNGFATVGGGIGNTARAYASTVGGGSGNEASGTRSTVGGGTSNAATNESSTIAGGHSNEAAGLYSVVAGGSNNSAGGGYSFVGGGAGNSAIGGSSVVVGGDGNSAAGDWSVAMGRGAQAGSDGCFVFSDSSSSNPTQCGVQNAFVARAKGGVYLITGGTFPNYSGALLPANQAAWTTFSDRAGKENIVAVDPRDVLERLLSVPISTWNWLGEKGGVRHMGPMAGDLHAAFWLGDDARRISTVDADGIALAAVQGVNAKLEAMLKERDLRIAELARALASERAARMAQGSELESQRAEIVALRSLHEREVGELRRALEQLAARLLPEPALAAAR